MKKEFLKELKTLMEKYDVTIGFSVSACSDTYGLYDEKMCINHRISKKSFKEETWLEVNGWNIQSSDIEE